MCEKFEGLYQGPLGMGHRKMVGGAIKLYYLVSELHGLKIFEIRFGKKVHIVQGCNVKKDWELFLL